MIFSQFQSHAKVPLKTGSLLLGTAKRLLESRWEMSKGYCKPQGNS
jgi:hypothetical protein